jgi:hypothetical protein
MSDQSAVRPARTQDNTTQKDENKYPCLKRDSKSRPQYPVDQGPQPKPAGNITATYILNFRL